jgi:stage III sporulation protein AE
MYKKFSSLTFFMILLFSFFGPNVHAQIDPNQIQKEDVGKAQTLWVDEGMSQLDLTEISRFWEDWSKENQDLFSQQSISVKGLLKGETPLTFRDWINAIFHYIFREWAENSKLLGTILMLSLLAALMQHLQTAFEKVAIAQITYRVIFTVLLILILRSFYYMIEYVQQVIERVHEFMLAIIPLLLALTATSGAVLSAAFFHPLFLLLVELSSSVVKSFIFPLLIFSTLLFMMNTLSDQFKVTEFAELLRTIAIGALGVFMTIFIGLLSIKGTITAISDGVAMKTAKYATSHFVPVIGKMFSDAADTAIAASLLIKNAIGLGGLFFLVVLVGFPLLKIIMLAVTYKIAAALIQPLGDSLTSQCLSIISKNVVYVGAVLLMVSLMFFFCITYLIAASTMVMSLR